MWSGFQAKSWIPAENLNLLQTRLSLKTRAWIWPKKLQNLFPKNQIFAIACSARKRAAWFINICLKKWVSHLWHNSWDTCNCGFVGFPHLDSVPCIKLWILQYFCPCTSLSLVNGERDRRDEEDGGGGRSWADGLDRSSSAGSICLSYLPGMSSRWAASCWRLLSTSKVSTGLLPLFGSDFFSISSATSSIVVSLLQGPW